jgi:hypothetical protein
MIPTLCVLQVLDALPDDALVAVLTFDSAVRLYNLAWEGGNVSADVLPGHCAASPALLKRLRDNGATRVAPLRDCRAAAQNVIKFATYGSPLFTIPSPPISPVSPLSLGFLPAVDPLCLPSPLLLFLLFL